MRTKPSRISEAKVKCERPAGDSTDGRRSHTPVYEASFARIAKVICMLGGSDLDLAAALGVEEDEIHKWMREQVDFREACRFGMDAADAGVERSLLQRSLGYDWTDVKVFRYRGRTVYVPYRVHVPSDVKAAIFWLVSRRPDKWSWKGAMPKAAGPKADLTAMLQEMREMRMPGGSASQKRQS